MNRCAWGDEGTRPRWSQGLEAAGRGVRMGGWGYGRAEEPETRAGWQPVRVATGHEQWRAGGLSEPHGNLN